MTTFPGFHPDFDIADYPGEIRGALRKISQNFYVTRSFKPAQFGNSVYYGALVRPTDEFSIYVNTDREVVVVFANYESFEIRTLEAYDFFYDLLESARIDKSVRFVISADHRVEKVIKHYLDQHPEYPIIIPITFQQIMHRPGNALLDSVRRTYILRDLFGYQNPLREETFFFGRQQVVNSVLDMAKSGQNSSLFGLRKSGKTSAIFAIQRKAKAMSLNVALMDCQSPAVHARSYDSLLSFLVNEIRRIVGLKKAMIDLGSGLASVSENFISQMNMIINNTKNSLLIIFDEIENISPETAASPNWKSGTDCVYFWQIIRSYIQSESKGRVSICIVGTSPRILEMPHIGEIANPVYLYAQKRFIPNFDFDNTREMVERLGFFMGLDFAPETIAELQKSFGGHPFFIRQVCSKIHQLASIDRPLKVSNAAFHRAKSAFSGQLESYLRDIIGQLKDAYPEEYRILTAVLAGDRTEVNEYGNDTPDLIDHLIGYGLIAKSGNEFDIKFEAIKTALNYIVMSNTTTDDRWAELSRRRNRVESDLRVVLYHWSKGIDSSEWHNIVEKCLTNKRREALSSLEPNVLFSRKDSPLYLSDLLMILKDTRVLPYLAERRSDIIRNMDVANRLRKDAHALELVDDDLIAARSAFDFLENEFAPP